MNSANILSLPLTNLPPGQYEVRLFKDNRYIEAGRISFEENQTDIAEVTVALVGELNWIEPQVFELSEGQRWPQKYTENVVLHFRFPVISAIDVETGEHLPIISGENEHQVLVPAYGFSKVIKLRYRGECITCSTNNHLPDWAETELINGYTTLSSGHFYRRDNHGDAFDYGNVALGNMGFKKITRMAKGHTSRFSTLWPSKAITCVFRRR